MVANDYNSDENSDNESRTTTEHPSTNSIDPSTVKISIADFRSNTNRSSRTKDDVEVNVMEKPNMTKSKANTFASIITGGRNSPNGQNKELIELMKLEVTSAEPQPPSPLPNDEKPTEIDVKSFKRKRRIEFMTRPTVLTVKSTIDSASDDVNNLLADVEQETQQTDPIKTNDEPSTTKSMYSNFVRGNVEFSDTVNATSSDNIPDDESNKYKAEISELRTIIESKLKFLCNGRPDVSAVQAIFIQFEVGFQIVQIFCS